MTYYIFLSSFLFTLCTNAVVIWDGFALHALTPSVLWSVLVQIGIAWCSAVCFITAITGSKWVHWGGLPVLFVTGSIASYFRVFYHAPINEATIGMILETHPGEARDFVSRTLLLWSIAALMVSLLLCVHHATLCGSAFFRRRPWSWLRCGAWLIILALTSIDGLRVNLRMHPYNTLHGLSEILLGLWEYRDGRRNIAKDGFTLTHTGPLTHVGPNGVDDDLTLVVVIGESARADHFGINGYERDTTPLLSAEPGVITYPKVQSCGVITRDSLLCMMTRATAKNPAPAKRESSFVSVLAGLGFETFWMGTQGNSSFNRSYLKFGLEAKRHFFTEDLYDGRIAYDTDLLAPFAQYLQQSEERVTGSGKRLIVIHTIGSHYDYDTRIPDTTRHFTPVCRLTKGMHLQDCPPGTLVNAYDNTIRYTDLFLHALITQLQHRTALLLYVSDHGESLGENGLYMHGHAGIAHEHHVPLILWTSPRYRQHYPKQQQALEQWAASSTPLTHDVIFPTVLGCAGVTGPMLGKGPGLCD